MAELHNSKLLSMILEQAEALGREYECKGTPRDFIVIAAIRLLSRETEGVDTAEREKALALVSRYSRDDAKLSHVLESWRGKETSMTEKIVYFADYIDDAYEMAMMIEEEGIVAMIKGMAARKDRGEVLQKSLVPVMMIFGRYDPRISVERANRLAEDNPSARIEWLENSGHNGLIEEPDRSIEIISDFVSKL